MSPLERSVKPDPDPTLLTTENLRREILGLRELLEQKISAEHDLSTQQFALIERQRVEQKQDTKTAVDAALSAQKEAVHEQTLASDKAISKSEQGTTKQIDQLASNFDTAIKGQTTQIDDLKERMTRVEQSQSTRTEQRTDARAGSALYVSLVAAGIFAVGLIVSVVALILKP